MKPILIETYPNAGEVKFYKDDDGTFFYKSPQTEDAGFETLEEAKEAVQEFEQLFEEE